MKMNRMMWLMAAAVLTLFSSAASATAQNIQFTTAQSLDAIESRWTSFESRITRLEMGGGGGGCGCTGMSTCNACSSCCETQCRTAGLIGSAELLIVRPFATEGGQIESEDIDVAGRFMLGY